MEDGSLTRLACLSFVGLVVIPACATVDPGPDFKRAADLVSTKTRASDVYNPDAEDLIESKVEGLLADGLTVDDAVCIAMLNNHSFQAMFQEIGASLADVVQSQLLTNPSVSLLVRFPEGGGRSNLSYSFGQELVDLWQIPVRKEIAEGHLEQTVLMIAQRAVELAAEVKRSCYEVLALERAEQVSKASLDLVERSLKLAENRFKAGEIRIVDVDMARADLLTVKREMATQQRDREMARSVLERLMGLSRWQTDWTLVDELPREAAVREDDDLIRQAMRQRLDAQAAALQVLTTEGELKREYLNIMPSVVVGAEGERPEDRGLPGRKLLADTARDSLRNGQLTAPTIQSKGERSIERAQIIDSLLGPSLAITLPIWDQNQAQIAKARFAAEQKRKEYEYLLDVVAQEVQQAATTARGSERLARMSEEEILPHARKSIENARNAFRSGQSSVIALIDAQRFLIAQQQRYVDDLLNCATALADLERVVGGSLQGLDNGPPPVAPPATQPDGEDGSDG